MVKHRTSGGHVSRAWKGALGKTSGWPGGAREAELSGYQWGSWTVVEEVARESLRGKKLLEQDRNEGDTPCAPGEPQRRQDRRASERRLGSE